MNFDTSGEEKSNAPGEAGGKSAASPLRRGLELVGSGAGHEQAGLAPAGEKHPNEEPHLQTAARLMQAIEDEVQKIRRGAGQLIPFQPTARAQSPRLEARLARALSMLRARVRRLATEKPLQTCAALCGLGFAIGAAFLLRRVFHK